jgi:hypothetical protein
VPRVEILDQAISRDNLSAVEDEKREETLLLRAQGDLAPVVYDLE